MCALAGTSRSTVTHLTSSIALARQEAAEQQLVEPFGHRRGRAVRQHRLGAERDRDLEPLAQPLGDAVVLRAALVPLPVHAGRAAVEHLHAVGADVAHAGLGILREHQRQRDVAARRPPASTSGSAARRACRRGCTTSWHGASLTVFGIRSRSRPTIGSIFSASSMPAGHLRRHQLVDLAARDRRASARRAPGTCARSSRTGWWRPACRSRSGCSNSSAGPPPGDLQARSVTAAISRSGLTGSRDRAPAASACRGRRGSR